jgi:2-polyprenyl-6-methoxyphenol hydroxylase-like FAD-dependent oxidoreductase
MSTGRYDVIIVGARVAGASTALLLARKGYRVLLVDRARFPSDIPHGHMIHKDGPRRLRDWGLLDRLVAAGTPPVDTVTTDFGDFPLAARNVIVDGLAWGYAPRRQLLDDLLIQAAVMAGAEFRDGCHVDALATHEGRVTGVRGHCGRTAISDCATLTIGADGRHSRIAAAVAAPAYDEVPPLLCYYFSYWSGVSSDGMEIHHAHGRAAFAHPTNDGLFAVFVAWPMTALDGVRANIERAFFEAVDGYRQLGERLRAGRREVRFCGATDLPTFRRRPFGAGWALVGDAGCHKDPYMALGMSDALRDADLLAAAVDEGLSERRPLHEALAAYEARRNAVSDADYQENLAMARLQPPPPNVLALRAALRGNPEQTTRFWMARTGLIPREAFFNPENLAGLTA